MRYINPRFTYLLTYTYNSCIALITRTIRMCRSLYAPTRTRTTEEKTTEWSNAPMEASLLVWWPFLLLIIGIICLRFYLRQTVYCRVTDRLDDKTVLITGLDLAVCHISTPSYTTCIVDKMRHCVTYMLQTEPSLGLLHLVTAFGQNRKLTKKETKNNTRCS